MEACKEYVMKFSQDEVDKVENAMDCIDELSNTFDDVLCSIDLNECPPSFRTLGYYFDQAQSALNMLYDFVNEYREE